MERFLSAMQAGADSGAGTSAATLYLAQLDEALSISKEL